MEFCRLGRALRNPTIAQVLGFMLQPNLRSYLIRDPRQTLHAWVFVQHQRMSERMPGTSLRCDCVPPRNIKFGASLAKSLKGLNALDSLPVPSGNFASLDRDVQSRAGQANNDSCSGSLWVQDKRYRCSFLTLNQPCPSWGTLRKKDLPTFKFPQNWRI